MPINRPLIRYHGGKFRLAPWLIQFFPPHRIYCEPFGGAASVLMQKTRSYAEVYNDLDSEIVNLFRVLQSPEKNARLIELLKITPFAREEFELAYEDTDCEIESARRVIIRAQMGFGSSGATKGTCGFRNDTSRRYTTAQMDWDKYPACLPPIIERFRAVVLENRPALQVIDNHDTVETLFYIDPPYVHSTRVKAESGRTYRHEMTDHDHDQLLQKVKSLQGMVVLNGYSSELYEEHLKDWRRHETTSRAAAFRGTSIRTEVVWLNHAASTALDQRQDLFAEVAI